MAPPKEKQPIDTRARCPGLRIALEIVPVRRRTGSGRADQSAAARLAAKRALLKALGLPFGEDLERQIVVPLASSRETGPPRMELRGEVADRARRWKLDEPIVSLSHTGELGVALVVLGPASSRLKKETRKRRPRPRAQ